VQGALVAIHGAYVAWDIPAVGSGSNERPAEVAYRDTNPLHPAVQLPRSGGITELTSKGPLYLHIQAGHVDDVFAHGAAAVGDWRLYRYDGSTTSVTLGSLAAMPSLTVRGSLMAYLSRDGQPFVAVLP
jgi:hypothetical protein